LGFEKQVEELKSFKELIEARNLRAILDKIFPLEQIVGAHNYAETGKKAGNIIITV
jgi:NADPH:quinone reductase-like Zn-dependent oxidoreductase